MNQSEFLNWQTARHDVIVTRESGEFPQFLGIGAQKAGTSWLHKMLSFHEEIWLPHLKELHYFDRKFPINEADPKTVSKPARGALTKRVSDRLRRINAARLKERLSIRRWPDLAWETRYLFGDWSDEWYASLFENARGRLAGEITPAYSCLSDVAISHVHSLMPDAKLILLLRDPIERAWSHARMDLAKVPGRPVEAIGDTDFLEHFTSFASRRRGSYAETIKRWLAHFSERQLFLGFYDEILATPEDLLIRIYRFLGVSATGEHVPRTIHARINAGAGEPIPDLLHQQLARLYVAELQELARQYGHYPQQWLVSCQRALDAPPAARL